ncbi:MAG: hypothetical protein GF392_03160 [Candidatus Omnitrophica bacterium]|nr:hypothetical protein [Candidatus Omnitrophota bacterium]
MIYGKKMIIAGALAAFTVTAVLYAIFPRITGDKAVARVRPSAILVGDSAEYSVRVVSDGKTEVELPDAAAAIASLGLEVRGAEKRETFILGRKITRGIVRFTGYTTGEYIIPGGHAEISREDAGSRRVKIPEKAFEIKTLIDRDLEGEAAMLGGGMIGPEGVIAPGEAGGVGESATEGGGKEVDAPIRYYIHDVRPPVKKFTPADMRGYGLVLGGVLLAAALAGTAVYGVLRKVGEEELPPARKALHRLGALERNAPAEKEFFGRILSIVRAYLIEKYGMKDTEMTSRELVSAIESIEGPESEKKKPFIELAVRANAAKYSGAPPAVAETREMIRGLEGILTEEAEKEEEV